MQCDDSQPSPPHPLCGLLIIDKPHRLSSMGVIRVVRRRAGGVKTGHAGTLDPLATGVLLVCLGRATKQVEGLMALEKRYETEIDLSAFSSTDDAEGELTPVAQASRLCTGRRPVPPAPPLLAEIEDLLRTHFLGEIMQRPPAYSAIKVGGRRAYKLARRGETVEIAPRPVVIHSIDVLGYDWPRLRLDIRCGKGTYIRMLARDLGAALGTGGYLTALRRTAIGPYTIDRAIPLDAVPDPLTQEMLLPVVEE